MNCSAQQATLRSFAVAVEGCCYSSVHTWTCTAAQVKFLTDEQAILVEDCAKAAAEAARVQEQLADQQTECVRLGAELAAAQKHGQELDCLLRAMTAEKVLSLSCTWRYP